MSKTESLKSTPQTYLGERHEIRLKLAELDGDGWLDDDDPLSDEEKALLEARLAAYEKDPDAGSSWKKWKAVFALAQIRLINEPSTDSSCRG